MVKKPLPKATITPNQLTIWEAPLQELMQQMADDVLINFIKHLTATGKVTLSPINAYAWQLEKLRDFGLINQENIKIVAQYTGKTEEAVTKLLVESGVLVYNEARKEFEGNAPVTDVKNQLKAMGKQTFIDVKNVVNQTLISTNGAGSVYSAYQAIINKTVAEVFVGVLTPEQALRRTIQEWIAQKGAIGYFVDKGNHKWSFESYVNTVINSTTMRMYNTMRTQAASDFGVHTFYMSHHSAARVACAPIQGRVVYDPRSGGDPNDYSKYPNLDHYGLGEPGGTFGINCHHYLTPFIPGVNELPSDKPIAPETAIKNGKKQAQQRQLERNVRNAKRDLKVSQTLRDQDGILKDNLRIKKNQAALRQIVKNNDFLHRDYNREFINVNNRKLFDELANNNKSTGQ
ncbi:phage minor capsid protein [Leuconostoc pseudomesenteroides]|uniref:phage minor capsid protein n=1 Tax=Leuconostoc pseudomesenteroides TaxID=33968 RepID=UPI00403D6124